MYKKAVLKFGAGGELFSKGTRWDEAAKRPDSIKHVSPRLPARREALGSDGNYKDLSGAV